MFKFELRINSRLEINLGEHIYTSTVQDIKEESFFISMPMEKGYYIKFEDNQKLDIYNYFEGSSMYKFECKVMGRSKCGNTPLYELSAPKNILKIQRREFFRVEIMAPIKIKTKDGKKTSALMLDLSGGGMRIKTAEIIEKNEVIEIELRSIGGKEAINIEGEIVRCERDQAVNNIYGISFYNIENKIREKIIQTIFSIMRTQKKPR